MSFALTPIFSERSLMVIPSEMVMVPSLFPFSKNFLSRRFRSMSASSFGAGAFGSGLEAV
ncbi:MAG: hypothetical protein BWY86_01205 [Candidatus Aminicenantes bacterium ADurb.Bin508]|nr:MAG: hypothetical protein BWY86_01205 [Candidatus Aminicenantes bacterium ADurb.Bin508]